MVPVDEWFPAFISRHTARHRREDWPKGQDQASRTFYQGWIYAFLAKGITPHHAERASLELVAEPPAFLSDHLPRLVKLALEFRRQDEEPPIRASLPGPEEDSPDREAALVELKSLVRSLATASRGREQRMSARASRAAQERRLEARRQDPSSRPDRPALGQPDAIIDAEFQSPKPEVPAEQVVIPEDGLDWV